MKDLYIKRYLNTVNNSVNSHVIWYFRQQDKNIVPCNVRFSENINEIRRDLIRLRGEILEIYNFELDIEKQFEEERAYHIEPFPVIVPTDEEMQKALDFAYEMHKNQRRKDGSLFINHPIRVASLVGKYYKGRYSKLLMECAYLHDVVEDSDVTFDIIKDEFGPRVCSIVSEVTNYDAIKNLFGKEVYLGNRMTDMSTLALILKLCDRLDNVSDLDAADDEFKRKVIGQTINILKYVCDNRIFETAHIKLTYAILAELLTQDISEEQREQIECLKEELKKKELTDSLILKMIL